MRSYLTDVDKRIQRKCSLAMTDEVEKKKCKKAKRLSEEALQIGEKREVKGKGEKER